MNIRYGPDPENTFLEWISTASHLVPKQKPHAALHFEVYLWLGVSHRTADVNLWPGYLSGRMMRAPGRPDDIPQVGQDHEAGDEDDDPQHGAGGQDEGLLQGHQPPGEMGPHGD